MAVQPVHCSFCGGVFLPGHGQGAELVQCPHCSAQMPLAGCHPAEALPGASGQVYIPVTEDEERAALASARHARGMRLALRLTAAAAGLAAAIFGYQQWQARQLAKAEEDKLTALVHEEKLAAEEQAELSATATRIFAAAEWQDLVPDVAGANTVTPAMRWHYTRGGNDLTPDRFVALGDFHRSHDGRDVLRLQVITARQPSVWMPFLREDGRWKLDWEAWSGADLLRWARLLTEPAGTTAEVRLHVSLRPGAEPYIKSTKADPATHRALHLWCYERAAAAAAVLPNNSPLWPQLAAADFYNAVKIIARVTMLDPAASPPLVRLDAIVQPGWQRQ